MFNADLCVKLILKVTVLSILVFVKNHSKWSYIAMDIVFQPSYIRDYLHIDFGTYTAQLRLIILLKYPTLFFFKARSINSLGVQPVAI